MWAEGRGDVKCQTKKVAIMIAVVIAVELPKHAWYIPITK